MLKLAVVEDEKNYADQLREFIRRYGAEKGMDISVAVYGDGDEIVNKYAGQFDIILMDIHMKLMDGMTAAEEIRKMDQSVIIIFITNLQQYAVRGYQVDALDYVVKPVEYFSFSQKLDRAVSRLKKNDVHYIPIYAEGGVYKVVTSRILFVESEKHNLHFYTTTGELVSRMKMGEAEKMLAGYGFYRCGKGYLINLDKVDSYSDGICFLGSYRVPVSRSRKKEFMNVLADHIGSRLV